jgi:hypothetical protein
MYIWYTTVCAHLAIQLQLFNQLSKKSSKALLMQTITAASEHRPNPAQQLLSDRYIAQNGMLLLRQRMSLAYRQKDIKNYLQLVRFEIDIKKGRIPFDQALKSSVLQN